MEKAEKRRLLSLTIALGILGGASLIIANAFFTPGKEILIPYAFIVLLSAIVLRGEKIVSFRNRFLALLSVFMLSTSALHFAIGLSPHSLDLSALGHLWRFGAMLAIGIGISLPMARITKPPIPQAVV